jgi:hypothetical protein
VRIYITKDLLYYSRGAISMHKSCKIFFIIQRSLGIVVTIHIEIFWVMIQITPRRMFFLAAYVIVCYVIMRNRFSCVRVVFTPSEMFSNSHLGSSEKSSAIELKTKKTIREACMAT